VVPGDKEWYEAAAFCCPPLPRAAHG